MSKYLIIGIMGYMLGMNRKQLSKRLCVSALRKRAYRLLRMI